MVANSLLGSTQCRLQCAIDLRTAIRSFDDIFDQVFEIIVLVLDSLEFFGVSFPVLALGDDTAFPAGLNMTVSRRRHDRALHTS